MESDPRNKIIELFEKHRATPGAPYDDTHFLDFLLADSKKKDAVYNSFRGLRRFNAFIDEVQYELAVCFSTQDRDANFSLASFVSRVVELQKSRHGSLKSLKNQERAANAWHGLVMGNIVLTIAAFALRKTPWALAALAGIAVIVNVWLFRFEWSARAYLIELRTRIETADE
jgi:hypothetical protein